MNDEKINIKLDKYEKGIVINALTEYMNKIKRENRITEPIEDLLIKIIDAPNKKFFNKLMER